MGDGLWAVLNKGNEIDNGECSLTRLGTSSTHSQVTTPFYDASGQVTGCASKSGDTTKIYDSSGRLVGKRP